MFNGTNWDRQSLLFGILIELLKAVMQGKLIAVANTLRTY